MSQYLFEVYFSIRILFYQKGAYNYFKSNAMHVRECTYCLIPCLNIDKANLIWSEEMIYSCKSTYLALGLLFYKEM